MLAQVPRESGQHRYLHACRERRTNRAREKKVETCLVWTFLTKVDNGDARGGRFEKPLIS